MKQSEFINRLNEQKEMQVLLYRRGYLFTDKEDLMLDEYPFYGNWNKRLVRGSMYLYYHRDEHFYTYTQGGITGIVIGHAYNPFSGEYREDNIVKNIVEKYLEDRKLFFDAINELTGIHIICIASDDKTLFVQDCTGMKGCYYGKNEDSFFVTSHCQLVRDIANVKDNEYIKKLVKSYSYLHNGSMYLPGDLTVLDGFFRLGPNTMLALQNNEKEYSIERFYPVEEHAEVKISDQKHLELIAAILSKTVELCTKKWNRPAISLSGGMDSRMTLAASTHLPNKYVYYSYYCKDSEFVDAMAAKKICDHLQLPHSIYKIEIENEKFENYDLYKEIILHGTAFMHFPKEHEIRKYITFSHFDGFDVELRSYASEIGRAHWGKRYNMDLPQHLTAKDFNIFQTRYLFEPKLMIAGEKAYQKHMEKIGLSYPMFNYDMADLFYWEYRFGSYDVLATEMMEIYQFDATIPMNNRKLLDLCLQFPYEVRRADLSYQKVVELNEPRLSNLINIVHDSYFSKKRVLMEKIYYKYRTMFIKR